MGIECKNCGTEFEITNEDLAFLDKLSPVFNGEKKLLPPPTECPPCRQMRRMSFRNERMLHERKCDVTGKDIISVHASDSPFTICEKNHWYSDKFDPLVYGRKYDFSRPFFDQFADLERSMPLPSLRVEKSENCEYNNDVRDCNNCYICARTHMSQNLLYTYRGNKSSDSVDCMQITKCESLYECTECVSCYNSKYLFFCSECSDSAFLLDCRNCTNCFMCTNLRNKKYYFLNEKLTKEKYEEKLVEFDFGSHHMVRKAYKMYADIRKKTIGRDLMIINSENCSGDNLFECKNCALCFSAQQSENNRHLWDVKLFHDSMDAYSGGRNAELIYFTTAAAGSHNVQFCLRSSNSYNVCYSFFINSSNDIFGSIGLKHEKYCILNKQYTKEEYEEMIPKIIEHMKDTGEWGEFFPANISPFTYNETVAQEYFPLSKEEAISKGYRWHDRDPKNYQKQTYKIPNCIDDVQDEITESILSCVQCKKNYKIVPQELSFYRKHRIPIPHFCHDCRHMVRFSIRNPQKLRRDKCKKCEKSIMTTFTDDTEMQIYCESCYLDEVY
ncbi:hypothetical protein HOF56_04865 [Candidatus Peribacteria bacterium]|jgi:hypothetical protein|nr:hypothetical protein [Candidatus Peribacteria bacterium]MBT4021478.1 hypothetical protein [Candidatus Peribacteria bacterium]MBT4240388.1 hypothetical protein [Candidatus Peribacteria bacterium]MBT4473811.1 hypothetical protein [Candidatus Peribacteria bacterium]